MTERNAQLLKDKRAKEKALLDRIGAEKRSLIISKALTDAPQMLGERHGFENGKKRFRRSLSIWLLLPPKSQKISRACRELN
jgi:hypothetical protein